MFKVGDMIKGLNNGYLWSCEDMLRAEVIYKNGYPATMGIRILKHVNPALIGKEMEVEDRESMFELIAN